MNKQLAEDSVLPIQKMFGIIFKKLEWKERIRLPEHARSCRMSRCSCSNEMLFKTSENCCKESVSTQCTDHLCPSGEWLCSDRQYISNRLHLTCQNERDRCISTVKLTPPRCSGRCRMGNATTHVGQSALHPCSFSIIEHGTFRICYQV